MNLGHHELFGPARRVPVGCDKIPQSSRFGKLTGGEGMHWRLNHEQEHFKVKRSKFVVISKSCIIAQLRNYHHAEMGKKKRRNVKFSPFLPLLTDQLQTKGIFLA